MSAPVVAPMQWRNCPSFPRFDVSEWGDVRRAVAVHAGNSGDRLRGFIDSRGCLRYALIGVDGAKKSVPAYRLVAEAFIGPPPTRQHEVAHNNGSRVCSHFSHLRWATRQENHHDMKAHGTSPAMGESNPKAKITESDVAEIRAAYLAIRNREDSRTINDLAARYGLHRMTIHRIGTGRSWSHIPSPALAEGPLFDVSAILTARAGE